MASEHKTMWTNAVLYSCVHCVSQVTKKNSIFISVYLIERRPTGEASGETLQISVCFIRMCFSFSFIFAKMNRYLYILGVFSVLVTLLHLCPPPPVFLGSPSYILFFFFCSMHCINMRHQFWHTSPLPQAGRDVEVHLWDSMLLKYIFMCCALYIPMS